MWFGTNQGLSRLIPQAARPPSPPLISIGGLRIGGRAYPVSDLGEAEIAGLVLGPTEDQIEVDFFSIGFAMGEAIRYQYKLEGADKDWNKITDLRTLALANLVPGTYRFVVRAVTADGVASATPATVAFKILRPVWQRWWFVMLATLSIALAFYALYRYRIAQLLEVERVRTRIAADLHDDIGAGLTRIAILSEVAGHGIAKTDRQARDPLGSIASASRELVDSMSDIVWAINPKRDHLSDLSQRMRRFVSDIFTAREIEFHFRAPGAEQSLRIGADVRREVFLIFKERINNMARHSECTSSEIELRAEGSWLVLRLVDNGKGFNPTGVSEGNGLTSMRARATKLGAELRILSDKGSGSTISLRVPLSHIRRSVNHGAR